MSDAGSFVLFSIIFHFEYALKRPSKSQNTRIIAYFISRKPDN